MIWAAPEPPGRDRDAVRAAGDDRRDGAGSPVHGLGDHAAGRGGDIRVDLRVVACRPCRNDEVRGQGGAVADGVDNDLSLLAGKRAGDRFRHLKLAGDESVGVADVRLGDVTGPTDTVCPLPTTSTDTVLVCPSTVSVTVQVAGTRMLSYCLVWSLAGVPAGITKSGVKALAIALGVDRDLPLQARSRTGDRLPHEQRADVVVDILDFHRLASAGRDGRLLRALDHHHVRANDAAVIGLGDGTLRSGRDWFVGLRFGARASPAADDEVLPGHAIVAGHVDDDARLRSGRGTGDRLLDDQRAGGRNSASALTVVASAPSRPGSDAGRR